ncbi:hypothetical protein ACIRSU_12590 [Streptomyces sp. NPDC101160]|uniref:hypothetical protein n=1 Tax=Streptomyces sp. NPDC101160 TaxID=3366118 RepID=UPI0037F9AA50
MERVTAMDDAYAAGSELVLRMEASDDTESTVLRRAVAALGRFAGEDLQPKGARSTRFLNGEGEAMTVALTHPAHSALNSWVQVSLGDFEPDGIGSVFMTVHLDEPGDVLQLEWEMAVALTTQLVAGLSPGLVHLTAWHLDGHGQIYPSTRLRPGSNLPEEFGPWTYVSGASGKGLTDQVRHRLAALPAYASQPLGDGWLVRAVENPAAEPTEQFLDALKALDTEPITYRAARLAAA